MTADPAIRAIAALDDDLRWRMYEYIRAARRPVTRDEAAAAVGISRKLAAFHLDKLVDAGALRAHYRPVETARKVGRSPKVYEPSGADIRVSIPQRSHDMLAGILLDAVVSADRGEDAREAAQRVARERGEQIGAAERDRAKPGRLGAERALTLAGKLLSERGFEPDRESATCLRLRNCPFHPLTARAPELVCGLNHAFISGMVDGLQASTVTAVLDPRAGECCVELRGQLSRLARQTRVLARAFTGATRRGRCGPAERWLRGSRPGGRPGGHPAARMALRHPQLRRSHPAARGGGLPGHRAVYPRLRSHALPVGRHGSQRPAGGRGGRCHRANGRAWHRGGHPGRL